MRFWRFRSGRGAFGGIGVGRVLLKTGQNLCGTSSPEPQNLQNLPDPRQTLARTLSEPPRQNLRTSERDPRRFWRFWRGLGEVFGGSEVLGQNLRFCIQNLRLVLYESTRASQVFGAPTAPLEANTEVPADGRSLRLATSAAWTLGQTAVDAYVKESLDFAEERQQVCYRMGRHQHRPGVWLWRFC